MPRCRYCSTLYKPARPMQPGRVCNSIECQAKHAEENIASQRKKRAQAERIAKAEDRKVVREMKDKQKTISQHADDTQKPVNAFIRFRDKDKGCISCGKPLRGTFHAGHYKPVGRGLNWFIRFHHDNIFGQCVKCNAYMGGNQSAMRAGVLERIGQERLDWIEGPHPDAKFTADQLKQISKEHRQLLKELRK